MSSARLSIYVASRRHILRQDPRERKPADLPSAAEKFEFITSHTAKQIVLAIPPNVWRGRIGGSVNKL